MTDKEYQRFGVYFDAAMRKDEAIIEDELRRLGVKANRSAVVRYALNAVAREIERQQKPPKE